MNPRQRTIWLDEALALIPPQYGRDEWREYFAPLLKRAHCNSKRTFWQFLRINLAKSNDTAWLLEYMQESRVPLEAVPKPPDDFEHTVSADGTTALIPLGDGEHQGIWKIPLKNLQWARNQFPVWLRLLPALEAPELKRQREITHQLRYLRRYMTKTQLASLRQEVDYLDARVKRLYPPVPRYCVTKSEGGRDIAVHRLFVGATEDDEIEAINGDFLDFTTTKVKVTLEPVPDKDGIAGGRGQSETRIVEVSNLQIVPMSTEQQIKFEGKFLPFKLTPQGDISEKPLRVMVNADLGKRTWNGDTGMIEDCGTFEPLTAREKYSPERFKGMPRKALSADVPRRVLDADAIRRKWRGF